MRFLLLMFWHIATHREKKNKVPGPAALVATSQCTLELSTRVVEEGNFRSKQYYFYRYGTPDPETSLTRT